MAPQIAAMPARSRSRPLNLGGRTILGGMTFWREILGVLPVLRPPKATLARLEELAIEISRVS